MSSTVLSTKQRNEINNFIKENKPSKLPLIDIKAKKTIIHDFKRILSNPYKMVVFGSEGFSYSNAFYMNDNILYVITLNYGEIESYAFYKDGYIDI
jgi:hypothetical protein